MGLFKKTIGEQIKRCRNDKAAEKVAAKIKNKEDCIEFLEHCPESCSAVGDRVLALLQDDHSLFVIILSDTVNSYIRSRALERIDPEYYPIILRQGGNRLSAELKMKIGCLEKEEHDRRLREQEEYTALLCSISSETNVEKLEQFAIGPNTDEGCAKTAIARMIQLYENKILDDNSAGDNTELPERLKFVFSKLEYYIPGLFTYIRDTDFMLNVSRIARIMNYSRDIVRRILLIGQEEPAEDAYGLGLKKDLFEAVLSEFCEHRKVMEYDDLNLFEGDRNALEFIDAKQISEMYFSQRAKAMLVAKYYSIEEVLALYNGFSGRQSSDDFCLADAIRERFLHSTVSEWFLIAGDDRLKAEEKLNLLKSLSNEAAEARKKAEVLLNYPPEDMSRGNWYYRIYSCIGKEQAEKLGLQLVFGAQSGMEQEAGVNSARMVYQGERWPFDA